LVPEEEKSFRGVVDGTEDNKIRVIGEDGHKRLFVGNANLMEIACEFVDERVEVVYVGDCKIVNVVNLALAEDGEME
jgi:hypothetical protein